MKNILIPASKITVTINFLWNLNNDKIGSIW